MMKKIHFFPLCFLILITACKKDNSGPDGGASDLKKLPGTIYYKWADEGVYKLDLASVGRSVFLVNKVSRNGWDVSLDNKLVLECSDVPGDYDASQFTITNAADGTIVNQFTYYATDGDIATGVLSPNGKMIAINPTFKDGIVITDLEGNVLDHITALNGEKTETKPVWMPDNTLLLAHKNLLIKTNADFTEVALVKEFDFQDWGSPAISRDGKKIAFAASKHIWLMNADGTDMKQVTASTTTETMPQFSPDGKYLLIGTDFHVTGPFGSLFYLKVIPADGQQYNVDDGEESKGVIPIKISGKNQIEAGDGKMSWR